MVLSKHVPRPGIRTPPLSPKLLSNRPPRWLVISGWARDGHVQILRYVQILPVLSSYGNGSLAMVKNHIQILPVLSSYGNGSLATVKNHIQI